MSEFDPYLKWLGIREKILPINHYRLLGLDLFEDDPDVISMAADRQMTHVRTYQSGLHGDVSQQILNELARARRCLLMADKKAEYDAQLSVSMSQPVPPTMTSSPGEVAPPPVAQVIEPSLVGQVPAPIIHPLVIPTSADSTVTETASFLSAPSPVIGVQTDVNVRAKTKKREAKQLAWGVLGWISGGLAAVGIAAALIGSGIIGGSRPDELDDTVPVVQLNHPGNTLVQPAKPSDEGTNAITSPVPEHTPNDPVNDPVMPIVNPAVPPSGLFNPDPFETRFDLTNLATYPKADPATFGVFGEVKRGLQDKKTVPFEPSASDNGQLIRVTPDVGSILIGLVLTTDNEFHIASVRPIFHDGFHAFAGNVIGSQKSGTSIEAGKDPIFAIAKPGFAVGEIDVSAVNPVRCVRVKYMKIGRQKLDTSEVYFSKWFGRETGPRRTIRNKNGLPVVGVYASLEKSGGLATLSLVGMDSDGKPETENVAGLPKIELPKFFDPDETKTEMPDDGIDPFAVDSSKSNPVAKVPEPSTRERTAAKKNIPDSIQLVMDQAIDVPSRILAAQNLIEAAESQNELVMAYVILKEAEALGISAGDARTAVDALRGIDKSFEIDFWKEVQKTIDKASRNSSNLTAVDFKKTMDGLIEEAKGKSEFDNAGKLLSAAIKLAKRAKDAESTDQYLRLEKEIKEFENLADASKKALVVLAADPSDPRANLDQGDFLFILKNDLAGALKYWGTSSDKKIVELVELESQYDDSDGIQLVELADAWRELGKSNRSPRDRKSLERALDLYVKAGPLLSGLEKQALELKLNELREMGRD